MHGAGSASMSPWTLLGGGVSAGIIVGVVSGLFYLVVAGIRWAGKLRELSGGGGRGDQPQLCERCGGDVGGGQRPSDARCESCGRPVCADCGAWRWRTADNTSTSGGGVGGPGHWLCAACHADREVRQQTGEWWQQQASRRFRTAALSATSAALDDDNGLGMEPESLQVREFIEKLVEKLVHGGLDDVCVGKLHSHPDYDRMFACHHANLCEALARLSFALQMAIANKPLPEEDSPTAAHAALKKLIHKIIGEAMTLPPMQQVDARKAAMPENYSNEDEMALKTYEDILATAILNKVIEKYQAHRFHNGSAIDGNSNILSSSYSTVSMEQQTKYISSLEIGVKKVDDESISSKEVSESDSDEIQWKKSGLTDPSLSLTIEERIEEVTTYSNSECEEDNGDSDEKLFVPDLKLLQRRVPFPEFGMDIVEGEATGNNEDGNDNFSDSSTDHKPTDIVSPVESWEENWLFQRRRLKAGGASTQMPVPMLVPNPSEDFRALIGDRDAEDISDLSECSDSALEETVLADVEDDEGKKHEDTKVVRNNVQLPVLVDIGETSDFDVLKEESIEIKSHSNNSSELLIRITGPEEEEEESSILDADLDIREATNLELMKASIDCSSEFGQKDSEYTEDYDAVTQRQIDSLTNLSEPESTMPPVPKPRSVVSNDEPSNTEAEPSNTEAEEPSAQSDDNVTSSVVEEETLPLAAPPRPGTENSDGNCTLPCTGTIAEREHKKWETAPPLPNNPYSPENISKRLSNRMKLSSSQSSSSEASVEFPDLQDENMLPRPIAEPLHIVCAPQDLDFKRYGRDYYVNSKTTEPEKKSHSPSRHVAREQTPRHNTSQVSDTAHFAVYGLEKQIMERDIHHASLRSRSASPHFKMNPLYEPDEQVDAAGIFSSRDKVPIQKVSSSSTGRRFLDAERTNPHSESGYGSSLDSLVESQSASHSLRLTPPTVPQVVERTLEPLSKIRRSESFKLNRPRHGDTTTRMGGSLRTRKFRGHDYLTSL